VRLHVDTYNKVSIRKCMGASTPWQRRVFSLSKQNPQQTLKIREEIIRKGQARDIELTMKIRTSIGRKTMSLNKLVKTGVE
jgi:biotin synthase-related radical SAM superfamily protein